MNKLARSNYILASMSNTENLNKVYFRLLNTGMKGDPVFRSTLADPASLSIINFQLSEISYE